MKYSKRQYEILNKSIKLIAEKGIQSLTIKNLSKSIGITEPAIYRHFENKFEILKAILSLFKDEIESNYSHLKSPGFSPLEKLEKIFDFHIEKFNSNPHYASVIFSEELFKNDPKLATIIEKIMLFNIEKTKKIIQEGQKTGEIRNDIKTEELAIIFLGSLRLLVKEWVQGNFKSDLLKKGKSFKKSILKIIKNNC